MYVFCHRDSTDSWLQHSVGWFGNIASFITSLLFYIGLYCRTSTTECRQLLFILLTVMWQVKCCEKEDTYEVAVKAVEDLVLLSGCSSYMHSVQHKQRLIQSLCHFVCIGRAGLALEQCVFLCLHIATIGSLSFALHKKVQLFLQCHIVFCTPFVLFTTFEDSC